MLDPDEITAELADLISRRAHDLQLVLGDQVADAGDITTAARRIARGLLSYDEQAAAAVLALAWPDREPEAPWWSSRLGAAATLASGAPSVSISRAASMVGVSRQRLYRLLDGTGPLDRHDDGGIEMGSLRAYIASR